jgi:chromosome segregation ATPase
VIVSQLATKDDLTRGLQLVRSEMQSLGAELRAELASKDDLTQGLQLVRSEIQSTAGELRAELASKLDLQLGLESLGGELRAELASKKDLMDFGARLRREMNADNARQAGQIANHIVKIMSERLAGDVRIVDEKYQDLPERVGTLRQDLDEHRADSGLHTQPSATPPKRVEARVLFHVPVSCIRRIG